MKSELEIVKQLVDSIENEVKKVDMEAVNIIAERIVNRTWASRNISTILMQHYPEIDIIADLAADIELEEEDSEYRRELWRGLLINLEKLKEKSGRVL